jgi:Zn-dependent metalloprotease
VSGLDLRLDANSTINVGDQKQIWFVELQQFHRGVPVEGAKVYFRINNGNIVQFGAERVAAVRTGAKPKIDRAAALAAVVQALRFPVEEIGEILDPGTLKLVPALTVGERPAEKYEGAPGGGYRHLLVWEAEFRHAGDPATWQAKVDAKSGQILSIVDLNDYAQVTGGIYPTTNSDPESVRGLPFANVTNGSVKVTDAAGNYTYSSGTATVTLNSKYIKMSDTCGSVSKSDSSTGTSPSAPSAAPTAPPPAPVAPATPTPPAPAITT